MLAVIIANGIMVIFSQIFFRNGTETAALFNYTGNAVLLWTMALTFRHRLDENKQLYFEA